VKTSCLINNYNYRQYVGEAVDSALAQTVPFDEIIVVDDGSTDGSLPWLQHRFGDCPTVRLFGQDNQGQLASFQEGFRRSGGDLLCFLDADDLYQPDYLGRVRAIYEREPAIDFVSAGFQWYGETGRKPPRAGQNADLGYSVVATWAVRAWVGAPTSCLSMRRWVLEKLLPLPGCEDWRTRADDCLIFGASLAGARKFRLAEPLVKYRIHGGNAFAGRAADPQADYRRRLAINRLFRHLVDRFGYDADRLPELAHREFQTIPAPTFRQLTDYVRLVFGARLRFSRRVALWGALLGHYLRAGRGSSGSPVRSARTAPGSVGRPANAEEHTRPAA
jgi:glycosyltransferase involved in cell wall biosynthesis